MFEEPVRQVTLNEDQAHWLKEGLQIDRSDTLKTHETRLRALQIQHDKAKVRLSSLYDLKVDKTIDEEVFKEKETEYKNQIIEIKSQIDDAQKINPNFYEDGVQALELCKLLHSEYLRSNHDEKAQILKRIASNYTLNDVTLTPVYKKPYIFFAKMQGCTNWLPR